MNRLKHDSNPLEYVIPREQSMHWRRRVLWALPLLLVAAIPLVIYIDSANIILAFMILMLVGTHIIVDLQVLLRANEVASRLRKMTGNLDLLLLTGIDARRLIFSQWWLIVRQMWVNTLPLIVLRLGTALAIAQYLHIDQVWTSPLRNSIVYPLFNPFFYFSHNGSYEYWYPVPIQFLVALFSIVILTYGEICLVAATGVCCGFWNSKQRNWLLVYEVGLRSGLVLMLLVLDIHLAQFIALVQSDPPDFGYSRSDVVCYDLQGNYSTQFAGVCPELIYRTNKLRILETIHLSLWNAIDGGTFLAANLLRPRLSHDYYEIDKLDFHYAYSYSPWEMHISAWRFIARMLAAAGLSVLLYALLIYGFLFSAHRRFAW